MINNCTKNASSGTVGDIGHSKTIYGNPFADVKGVPGFWLTIFKNVDMLAEMVQVCNAQAPNLQHHKQITCWN